MDTQTLGAIMNKVLEYPNSDIFTYETVSLLVCTFCFIVSNHYKEMLVMLIQDRFYGMVLQPGHHATCRGRSIVLKKYRRKSIGIEEQ